VAPRAWVVSDELWELVEPLLPSRERPFRHPARRRLPDRQCLQGILFRPPHRHPCHDLPPRARPRLGGDLLAPARGGQRAGVWGAFTACLSTSSAPPMRSTSAGRSSTPARCRRKRGLQDGPEAGRPRSARLQAPPPGRRNWRPARGQPDRRQPQRHHPADPAGGRGPADRRTTGRPAPAPPVLVADRGYDHDAYRRQLRRRGTGPRSPAARPPTARAWGACAGRSSAASPGCTSSAACWCASSGGPICTRRS
jgi:transposase